MAVHRLSTIRFADKIAVVHQGTIVEEGKHDELMAIKDGHYQKLYALPLVDHKPAP